MNGRMIQLVSAAVLIASIQTVSAQAPGTPPESNIPEEPFAWATVLYELEADFDDQDAGTDAKAGMQEVHLLGSVPIIWDDPMLLLAGPEIRLNRFEFKNVDIDDINAYTLAFPIDLLYEGVYPWQFLAGLKPGLFSDLEQIDGDDFRLLGYAMAMYPANNALTFAAGVSYDQIFGEDRFYPVGGIIWNPSPEWEIELIFPMPAIKFAPTRQLSFYLKAEPAGDNWSIYQDDQEYNFTLESLRVGGGVEYAISERIWIQAATGMDMDRNYEIHEGDAHLIDSDVEDTWFARVGILVR